MVTRPMRYLALSYVHRVVDGKEAVTFLIPVKNCIENPVRFLLGLERRRGMMVYLPSGILMDCSLIF